VQRGKFWILLAGLGSVVALPAMATASASALNEAAEFCAFNVRRAEGVSYTLPSGAISYQPMRANVVKSMRSRGMKIGPTTADLPELVSRFASTQPMARLSNVSPQWFDYVRFGRNGSFAWAISHPSLPLCDILITDTVNFLDERDKFLGDREAKGWSIDRSKLTKGALFWSASALESISDANSKLPHLTVLMQGLDAGADRKGVQMEIQFRRVNSNPK
jgi:hypothetical protein